METLAPFHSIARARIGRLPGCNAKLYEDTKTLSLRLEAQEIETGDEGYMTLCSASIALP